MARIIERYQVLIGLIILTVVLSGTVYIMGRNINPANAAGTGTFPQSQAVVTSFFGWNDASGGKGICLVQANGEIKFYNTTYPSGLTVAKKDAGSYAYEFESRVGGGDYIGVYHNCGYIYALKSNLTSVRLPAGYGPHGNAYVKGVVDVENMP
ncbi:MAG: hypothetical protein ABIH00_10945 [Armatimonadota bacterium]